MMKLPVTLAAAFLFCGFAAAADILIAADEFPAMETLAAALKKEEGLASRIVKQTELPADLAPFRAVIVYIHMALNANAEKAFIDYTKAGGKLIALHHSISSGKRTNEQWFAFLGVSLPKGDVAAGGYKWIEPVTLQVVKLPPDHFITTNQVRYESRLAYTSSEAKTHAEALPGFTLNASEVYLNHTFTGPRTLLLGFKYTDAKTGEVWMQDRAGWYRPAGKGWIFYFLPGHSRRDFEHPAYARIVLNAVRFQPPPAPEH